MKKARKKYHSPQEKVAILRRYLIDKIPVSRICDQFQLQHRIFYVWLKQLVDNGRCALNDTPPLAKGPMLSNLAFTSASRIQRCRPEMNDFIDTGTVRERGGPTSRW